MIIVNEVSKSYGTRTLFDNVSVKFTPGNRYGLTGPNGAGKSTFMKILSGEIEPSNRGTISKPQRLGVLKQDQFEYDDERIIDTVMMGKASLWNALKERNELCEAEEFTDEMMNRLGDLETIIADENGYEAEVEAAEILRGIGLANERHTDPMNTLPNDFKFRVLLAQALFAGPDALMLDEPTNHMDLESIHWLEDFLYEYKGTLLVISHDRHFLNAVCTHVADIDYDTIIVYPGNYDDMVEHKMQARDRVESGNRDKAKKIAQLQEFVSRFAAGQRSSQVQSRRKEMARLAPAEMKRSNIQRPFIRFEQTKPSSREILEVEGLTKSFDGRKILDNVNLEIVRGDKIAIIGGNGVGKTTLIRCLIGELEPDSGSAKWGFGASWGYYPQDYRVLMPNDSSTALDWIMQYVTDEGPQVVRGMLGRMLFAGDDALKPTSALSGGEAARLLLAKLMLMKDPILIFDEPTNHLDLEAVSALAEGLSTFPGTVLVVSHDRDLISEVSTRVLSFTPEGLIDFRGTYDEYLEEHPLPVAERRAKW
ncbi:MAG: ATP-binding cassette domain-containing protein [Capsulimonas sp.]|uniref:ABC-F family ATP-binding cassette domain-containing protein n=1 Tax=Capsulimonas sp. TaxID=2494211 RepID=UPI0032643364